MWWENVQKLQTWTFCALRSVFAGSWCIPKSVGNIKGKHTQHTFNNIFLVKNKFLNKSLLLSSGKSVQPNLVSWHNFIFEKFPRCSGSVAEPHWISEWILLRNVSVLLKYFCRIYLPALCRFFSRFLSKLSLVVFIVFTSVIPRPSESIYTSNYEPNILTSREQNGLCRGPYGNLKLVTKRQC